MSSYTLRSQSVEGSFTLSQEEIRQHTPFSFSAKTSLLSLAGPLPSFFFLPPLSVQCHNPATDRRYLSFRRCPDGEKDGKTFLLAPDEMCFISEVNNIVCWLTDLLAVAAKLYPPQSTDMLTILARLTSSLRFSSNLVHRLYFNHTTGFCFI